MAILNTIALSQLEDEIRFDPQYYTPDNMLFRNEISGFPTIFLGAVAIITDGQHGYFKLDEQSEIRQITAKCIKEGLVDKSSADRLSSITHLKNLRSSLEKNDVLVTTAGTIGQIGLVTEEIPPANIDQDIGRIAIHNSEVSPFFVWAFLQSKFGRFQLERFTTGQVQTHLSLKKMGKLRIPLLSDHAEVEGIVGNFVASKKAAKDLYEQAQQLLESELGLDKLNFQKPVGYTARFSTIELSNTFNAGRIDAQCFAPNAIFYQSWLRNHARCDRLTHLLQEMAKGRQQEETSTGSTDYCSIKHISGHELTDASKCQPIADTPLAGQDDILLAITGATIGKIGIVKRYKKLAFSGDLLCLKANSEINPHYLLAALDHTIGQVQFNRWITGSTNGHLAPRDVGRVLVPRLKEGIEALISGLVEESLSKRVESEKLLRQAKTRVEQLIEEAVRR
jgi:type I restriction enzyme S subunit